jgi:peptidoglycan hydrolase CwlO-like protein
MVRLYQAKQNQTKHQKEIAEMDLELDGLNIQLANLKNETEEDRAKIAELHQKIAQAKIEREVSDMLKHENGFPS